jgi:hypothetical protein
MKYIGLVYLAVFAFIAFALFYAWQKIKAEFISGTINPASPENVVYKGLSETYQDATGTPDTIGTALYGWLHPFEFPDIKNNPLAEPVVKSESVDTLGTMIYGWLHPGQFSDIKNDPLAEPI